MNSINFPRFTYSKICLAIAVVMANPKAFYPDRLDWQDIEQGQVCKEFADFVETWTEQTTFTADSECSYDMDLYYVTADGIPFSFRRIDDSYSIVFNGHAEKIQLSTFEYFVQSLCKEFEFNE